MAFREKKFYPLSNLCISNLFI